jgi:hypothetical protein
MHMFFRDSVRHLVAVALGCGLCVMSFDPAFGQDKAKVAPDLMKLLDESIETKGLHEKVRLKNALEHLFEKSGGRVVILVDRESFENELGADAPSPYEEDVSLPPVPVKMSLGSALRILVAQVAKGSATYMIRRDHVEITTRKASSAAYLLQQATILASFEKRPLVEVLQALTDESGLEIHLDPSTGKADVPVSARFRNTPLENALVVATEMAELKFVVLERSIFVTTAKKVDQMQREENRRAPLREKYPPMKKRLEAAAE